MSLNIIEILTIYISMASGKHLLGACSAGVKGKLSSFFPTLGGNGRGIRTVQMAGTFAYFTSKQINTYNQAMRRWVDYRNPM